MSLFFDYYFRISISANTIIYYVHCRPATFTSVACRHWYSIILYCNIVLQVTMLQLFTISHDLVFLFPTAAESHYRTRGQYAYTFIYIIYNI